jgi:hypothetical protein
VSRDRFLCQETVEACPASPAPTGSGPKRRWAAGNYGPAGGCRAATFLNGIISTAPLRCMMGAAITWANMMPIQANRRAERLQAAR